MAKKSDKRLADLKEVVVTALEAGLSIIVWMRDNNMDKKLLAEFQMNRLLKIYVDSKWYEIKKRKRIISLYHSTYIRMKKAEKKVDRIDGELKDIITMMVDRCYPLKKSA